MLAHSNSSVSGRASLSPRELDPAAAGTIPVWLDCDPGHDDAMAIVLAGHNSKLRLLGISTVAGNQTVDKVTLNALGVVDAAGLQHINVYKGQSRPLMRPLPILCPEIHGDSGLDGPEGRALLPAGSKLAQPGKAVLHMYSFIMEAFRQGGRLQKVRVICTGALSNVALLVSLYPEVIPRIEVVLMGGAMGVGNTGPVMEFNIQTDPEAAKIVFECGAPVVMLPVELTHTALVTPDVLNRISAELVGNTPFLHLVKQLLLYFAESYKTVFKFDNPPLHDPCAVAYVIAPEMFQVELMRVDIETISELSAGQTVCDVWHQSSKPKNVSVAQSMDVSKFWDLMINALKAANEVSPLNKK
ncbi:hypothetical protein WJX82_006709 [Trebouxia sp. C0006]